MIDKGGSPIAEIQKEILEEIEGLSTHEKFEFIMDHSEDLESFPEELKTEDRIVKGCASQVWFDSYFQDGKVWFRGDSDSLFVKGVVALMIRLYSGHAPQEIIDSNPNFLLESGLLKSLSVSRGNGAAAMLRRIMKDANQYRLNLT